MASHLQDSWKELDQRVHPSMPLFTYHLHVFFVHAGAMGLQMLRPVQLLLANVTNVPLDIDAMHFGAMGLQMLMPFELLLANVTKVPLDIDTMHFGAMRLPI